MTLKPSFSYHMYHFFWSGLDLLFPPSCGGCGKLGARWCIDCQQKMEPVPLPICEICGAPQNFKGICQGCQTTRPAFSALRSCAIYKEPVRPALIKMKYRNEIGLGEALAWNLAMYLEELGWQADVLIPIPLSEQRLAERGYNQVDLIAHPLARLTGCQYLPKALRRVRHTISQVGLSGSERRVNVNGAFHAEARVVQEKIVLVLDDIATTGATIQSASSSLLDAGAKKVYALTFAKAMKRYGADYEKSLAARPLC